MSDGVRLCVYRETRRLQDEFDAGSSKHRCGGWTSNGSTSLISQDAKLLQDQLEGDLLGAVARVLVSQVSLR